LLSGAEKTTLQDNAEQALVQKRQANGEDSDSRMTAIVDIETAAIRAIDAEENEMKKKTLAKGKGKAVGYYL
jgi:hypothetical protein